MNGTEIEIIKSLCYGVMRIARAAEATHRSRNDIVYHIKKIKKKYGLDPLCFHDLIELEKIADNVVPEPVPEEPKYYCKRCGKKITAKGRRKFCSSECSYSYWNRKPYRRRLM